MNQTSICRKDLLYVLILHSMYNLNFLMTVRFKV